MLCLTSNRLCEIRKQITVIKVDTYVNELLTSDQGRCARHRDTYHYILIRMIGVSKYRGKPAFKTNWFYFYIGFRYASGRIDKALQGWAVGKEAVMPPPKLPLKLS